jgi:hypothetical protein
MTQFSAQELLDRGDRVICPGCKWLVMTGAACRRCGHRLRGDTPTPPSGPGHKVVGVPRE